MIMVVSCCMRNCTNRFVRGSGINFYRIPSKPKERREKWIQSINRKTVARTETPESRPGVSLWIPSKYDRICGEHFVTGRPVHNPLHPDYVPSKKLGYMKKALSTKRYDNLKKREEQKERAKEEEKQKEEAANILLNIQENTPLILTNLDKGTQTHNDVTQNIFILKSHIRTLEKEIHIVHRMNIKLRAQVEDLKEEARNEGRIFSVNMQDCLTPTERNPALLALLSTLPAQQESNTDAASYSLGLS